MTWPILSPVFYSNFLILHPLTIYSPFISLSSSYSLKNAMLYILCWELHLNFYNCPQGVFHIYACSRWKDPELGTDLIPSQVGMWLWGEREMYLQVLGMWIVVAEYRDGWLPNMVINTCLHPCTYIPLLPWRRRIYFLIPWNCPHLMTSWNAAEMTFWAQVLIRLASAFTSWKTVIGLEYVKKPHYTG